MCKQVKDIQVKGRDGHQIPVRLYYPEAMGKLPIVVYYHRGGWVFSNVEEADPSCRRFANHLGCIVASVDYRLAPENPFPKPLNDCYDALEWVSKNREELGGSSMIVAGESAGGNMAASVALQARDKRGPNIDAQILMYPLISPDLNVDTYRNSPDQSFITMGAMHFFWNAYLQNPEDAKNPYACLDKVSDLKGLPPAIVVTAEYDPLHAEGEQYACRLKAAGNTVEHLKFPKVIHGFLDLPLYSDKQIVAWIKTMKQALNTL